MIDASLARGELEDQTDRLTVVTGDSHVGPRLKEDLRSYCPHKYLTEFDQFIVDNENTMDDDNPTMVMINRSSRASKVTLRRQFLNRETKGHFDIHARLRDMDWDGIAAEVIFHGSQNTEVFPFSGRREFEAEGRDLTLMAVGYRMYNRWLSDFVSIQPERHIGLAYLPMWDVDLAVKELEWAAAAGLRGVNFPAPRAGLAGEYDDPVWEPLWSACEGLGLNLVTHAGLPTSDIFGPQAVAMLRLEVAGWPVRRGMQRLIFGGVFARHPGLKIILTEQARGWWNPTIRELDSVYEAPSDELRKQVPRRPSEYMRDNVLIGASFMPPSEVHEAIDGGYASQVIWGSDYPHGEGTYKYPEYEGEESQTRHYLRWAFADCPLETAQVMLSENAIRAYGLDRKALAAVAAKVGPTPKEVIAPLRDIPDDWIPNLVDVQTGTLARNS
jgi:predicted TIM-barrel fold metal-dependent hydrolase